MEYKSITHISFYTINEEYPNTEKPIFSIEQINYWELNIKGTKINSTEKGNSIINYL